MLLLKNKIKPIIYSFKPIDLFSHRVLLINLIEYRSRYLNRYRDNNNNTDEQLQYNNPTQGTTSGRHAKERMKIFCFLF